jgi:hypothetical protein
VGWGCSMAESVFEKGVNLRTTEKAQRAISRVVYRLKLLEPALRWGNRSTPTKEAIINASWLYLDSLDDAELARIFGEWLPRLEALMSGQERPPGLSGGVNLKPPDEPARKKKSG